MMFTTYDRDNDQGKNNCGVTRAGGFWYKGCDLCGVNNALIATFRWNGLTGGDLLLKSRMWLECK